MARVLTNNTSIAYSIETSLGVPSTTWKLVEPNDITTYGAEIATVPRDPISKNRQRQKGAITDLDSSVEFEADLTKEHFIDFVEGYMFANFQGAVTFVPTAVVGGGSSGYTVASGGALTAGTLVYARGFDLAVNNGLKVVASGSTGVLVRVDGLSAEASPPANVSLEEAGVQGASDDFEIDASGNIISTTLDFTTLPLIVGQGLHVGGQAAVTQFATAADTGFVRVSAVATNEITIDKTSQTFTIDNGASKTIQLLFGRFVKNVPVDDAEFLERSFHFEATWTDLDSVGTDEYEYAEGNFCNQMTMELPLTDKATCTFNFIGTDTQPPSTSRETGAATPLEPVQTAAFNTSADIARLRIQETDETGLTTDFKSLTVTFNNNVNPEKVLGTLGARYMNAGNFEVDAEAQLVFSNGDVVSAIRENRTLTMDFVLTNSDDGGIMVDIPSLLMGGGDKELPINESVLINVTNQGFQDGTLGYTTGVTLFPFVPTS